MSAYSYPLRIELHRPYSSFTNLDEISGRVILSLLSQETIAGITVKLEGESRTRLAGGYGPPGTYDPYARDQTQLEVHKLLYKVLTVFPTQDILRANARNQYTLPPGQHEYPFKLKIPFNNDCLNNNSVLANLSSMRMDMVQGANAHVKRTLPPTLTGLPGEAEIQYYVKATVQRPAFYKENWRHNTNFMFFPIEPPRPPPNRRESYARLHHRFAPPVEKVEKPGLFHRTSTSSGVADVTPPSISVEGRLPEAECRETHEFDPLYLRKSFAEPVRPSSPAILTCNEALPLRILVTKVNESPATLYLQSLQLDLLGFTTIRAHQLRRNEAYGWTVLSTSNMRQPLQERSNSETTTTSSTIEIASDLWKQRPLPNNVSPTFHTCNISRTYRLHIKVGLSWGTAGNINPELNIQLLRMPVDVYSGIPPPQALLAAMSNQPSQTLSENIPPTTPARPLNSSLNGGLPGYPQETPTQTTDHIEPSPEDIPPDAPPSYEDAIADNIGPIDGPRREYRQTTAPADEKGRGRLFDDNTP